MPLGNVNTGTGNIYAYTSNANVTGIGTTFLTQLNSGSLLANIGNVFIGYVAYITSNTNLVLRANSNVAVSNTNFNYQQYVANVANITYNCVGNITTNTTTNIVFGNNTAFISNLNVGDTIYLANSYPNYGIDNYLGTVSMIIDNYSLYLTDNCSANVTDRQFYNISCLLYLYNQH